MNIGQIEKNLTKLIEDISPDSFIYDLLLVYGTPKTTVTLLKKGNRNLSKKDGQIILKRKLFFQEAQNQDLHGLIDSLKRDDTNGTGSHRRSLPMLQYESAKAGAIAPHILRIILPKH